jgi:hypothetical protein
MLNLSSIDPNKRSRIITRPVLLVSVVSLLTDIASEMLYPVMPIFLKSIGFTILLTGSGKGCPLSGLVMHLVLWPNH